MSLSLIKGAASVLFALLPRKFRNRLQRFGEDWLYQYRLHFDDFSDSYGGLSRATLKRLSDVEKSVAQQLYWAPHEKYASAIRLCGAGAEFFKWRQTRINYRHAEFTPAPELLQVYRQAVDALDRKAEFNGPCVRLASWSAFVPDDSAVGTEKRTLELNFTPIGWFDYKALNRSPLIGGGVPSHATHGSLNYYVGWDQIIRNGDISHSRLSNICSLAISVVSNDGYIGFQQRGGRVTSSPTLRTSAVAENINRYYDQAHGPDDWHGNPELLQVDPKTVPTDFRPHHDQISPFVATRRGISQELSPALAEKILIDDVLIAGLAFDLTSLHPDLLIVVLIDHSKNEIMRLCREHPGEDYFEGQLNLVPFNINSDEVRSLMGEDRWVGSGKASFIRTFELFDAVCREYALNFGEAFTILRRSQGTLPAKPKERSVV